MLPEAYEFGREACFDGKPAGSNPYLVRAKAGHTKAIDSSRQWDQGWADADQELRTVRSRFLGSDGTTLVLVARRSFGY